jgi:ADP-heptose:LPS heptosyltransferase
MTTVMRHHLLLRCGSQLGRQPQSKMTAIAATILKSNGLITDSGTGTSGELSMFNGLAPRRSLRSIDGGPPRPLRCAIEGGQPMLGKTRDKFCALATHKQVTVLLVRPDGLGDQILCLPVATALRRCVPKARIIFLSSKTAAPILDHHPDLDEIRTLTGQERFAELVALFKNGIDAAVFLKPFRRLMAAAFVARVPFRVATGYRWYSFLANRRIYQHRHDFSKHESEYNLHLLTGLGLDPGPVTRPVLMPSVAELKWSQTRLAGLPEFKVVVHPGGLSARRWQQQHYWDLAKRLLSDGYGVILTGSQAEREQFEQECGAPCTLGSGLLDLMGQLTLRELMAVIGTSDVVVSGATGPAHIAAALDVSTVSIYDPRRNNNPIRWKPLGKGVVVLPDVPTCEKCIGEACPYWDCLDRITVDEVMTLVGQMAREPEPLTVVHV